MGVDAILSAESKTVSWLMEVTLPVTPPTLSEGTHDPVVGEICVVDGLGPFTWEITSPSTAYLVQSGGQTLEDGKRCELIADASMVCTGVSVSVTVTDQYTGDTATFTMTLMPRNLEWAADNPTVTKRESIMGTTILPVRVYVEGGVAPFAWEITSGNSQFKFYGASGERTAATAERWIYVTAYYDPDHPNDSTYSACGGCTIQVTDACGDTCIGGVRCDFGEWARCFPHWWGACLGSYGYCVVPCDSEYNDLKAQGFELKDHGEIYVSGRGWLTEWTWDIDIDLGRWTVLHRCCDRQNFFDDTPLSHTYDCTATGRSFTYVCGACNCGREGNVKEFTCPIP